MTADSKITVRSGVLLLWACCLALPAAVRAQELIRNGSFGAAGSDGKIAADWRDASPRMASSPVFAIAPTGGPDGGAAQTITAGESSGAGRPALAQTLPVPDAGLYRFRVRVKAEATMSVEVQVRLSPPPGTVYGMRRAFLKSGIWTEVRGFALLPPLQNDALFVVQLQNTGTLHVAEASLQATTEAALSPDEKRELQAQMGPPLPPVDEGRLLAETDARIRKNRAAPLTVRLVDKNGKPLANQTVEVRHVRHLFRFGTQFQPRILPKPNESVVQKREREAFLTLFNYATIDIKWGGERRVAKGIEMEKGKYLFAERKGWITYLRERNITPRGHVLFWNAPGLVPPWMHALGDGPQAAAQVKSLMDNHLRQVSENLLHEFSDVDVWNELVQWDRFQNPVTRFVNEGGKTAVVAQYLKDFKRLNPNVKTVVNDFDSTPAAYYLLEDLIKKGAPVDMIGQQTHGGLMGGPKQLWGLLERLSLLKRPVLFTELSSMSGQRQADGTWRITPETEARQADEMETFYRLAYSHPNCVGVVLWDFSDLQAWKDAPRGVLRTDGTRKPSFAKLDNLINKAWRTKGTFTTDANGTLVVPDAWAGEYEITSGGKAAKAEHSAQIPLRLTLKRQ